LRYCWISAIFLGFAGLLYLVAIVASGLSAKPVPSDIAVVLGNEVLANGEPSMRLRARLDCAASLYRKGVAPLILVSGGRGKSGFDEATVMKEYLRSQGIPAGNILTDSHGVNTMMTALNTAELARAKHFSRILIVTQYFHIPRTLLAFRRAGLLSLSSDYPRYYEWLDPLAIVREGVALPVYFIKMPGKE
jgi:vancomycin permeability regulator SanA